MLIKPELRWFFPSDWPDISRRVRFERAGGVCEGCRQPLGQLVRRLPDVRWFDANIQTWRNNHGRPARSLDLVESVHLRQTRIVLALAHLDHDPRNNQMRNLKSLSPPCHVIRAIVDAVAPWTEGKPNVQVTPQIAIFLTKTNENSSVLPRADRLAANSERVASHH
jgi:hypothetical protein